MPEVHESIYAAAAKLAPGYGRNFGNNIFPGIPELGKVLGSPTLVLRLGGRLF